MSSDFGFDVCDFSVGLLWHGPKHVFRLTMWLMQKIQKVFALTRPSLFALMSSRDFKHNNRKGISNISRRREFFMCPGRSEVRLASPLPFSILGPWKNKETRNKKERREIGPCFPGEAAFSQASSLLLLVDCSMTGFPVSWALLARLRSDPASNNWKMMFPACIKI